MSYRSRNDARRARSHARHQALLERWSMVLRETFPQPDLDLLYAEVALFSMLRRPG